MPFARWEKGQRLIPNGPNVFWVIKNKSAGEVDHAEFRRYLDAVFNWANSTSLSARSTPVAAENVLAGDFFLQSQEPNHVAVVLDLAEKPSGERVALRGSGPSRRPGSGCQAPRHARKAGRATGSRQCVSCRRVRSRCAAPVVRGVDQPGRGCAAPATKASRKP